MWTHNIMRYRECVKSLLCSRIIFELDYRSDHRSDHHINQLYIFFFTSLISWRWTQMVLLEQACRTCKGQEGHIWISFGS